MPQTLDSGEPFPDRGFIVFVTSGVILLTLVIQGHLLLATAAASESLLLRPARRSGLPTA